MIKSPLKLVDETSLRLIKNDIINLTLNALEEAFKNKKDIIDIVEIDNSPNTNMYIKVDIKEVPTMLDYIFKYAIENELFEICSKVNKLKKIIEKNERISN